MAMAMAICIVADVVTITDGAGAVDITTAGVIIVTITRACSVLIESEPGSSSLFDAFSSREPVATSLENAVAAIF
jgi:hypothetical protein